MDNFNKWLWIFLILFLAIFITYITDKHEKEENIIRNKTQECYRAWWDEYYYWNWDCVKVLQERKTETILLTK